jgi:NTE family protein
MYLAADTLLGPCYLAVGLAEAGNTAVYLFLGRPL